MAHAGGSIPTQYSNITISENAQAHLGDSYVTNIHITTTLAREVYRACIKSSDGFRPLANEIAAFRSLLEITEESVAELEPDHQQVDGVVRAVIACRDCLQDIQTSVSQYNSLPTASQRAWDRTGFGVEELASIQARLGRNVGILSALNSAISNSSQIAVKRMLQKFMDEVQSGKREGSVVSTNTVESLTMDEKQAWRALRKELEDVGITPNLFTQYRDFIIKTLQDAISAGLLQESSPAKVLDSIEETLEFTTVQSQTESTFQLKFEPLTKPLRGPREERPSIAWRALRSIFPSASAISEAAGSGDRSRVRWLLHQGVDTRIKEADRDNALRLVSQKGYREIVHLLLAAGAQPNKSLWPSVSPLEHACREDYHDIVYDLVEADDRRFPIYIAYEEVLMYASKYNSPRTLLLFISQELDVINQKVILGVEDRSSTKALMMASRSGDHVLVKRLLADGASVDSSTAINGRTALSLAHDDKTIQILLDHGANIKCGYPDAMSALRIAVQEWNLSLVHTLLDLGDFSGFEKHSWDSLLRFMWDDWSRPADKGATSLGRSVALIQYALEAAIGVRFPPQDTPYV